VYVCKEKISYLCIFKVSSWNNLELLDMTNHLELHLRHDEEKNISDQKILHTAVVDKCLYNWKFMRSQKVLLCLSTRYYLALQLSVLSLLLSREVSFNLLIQSSRLYLSLLLPHKSTVIRRRFIRPAISLSGFFPKWLSIRHQRPQAAYSRRHCCQCNCDCSMIFDCIECVFLYRNL